MGLGPAQASGLQQFCSECGKPHATQDLAYFGALGVCADCKPAYVQRLREGVVPESRGFVYGGFWRRFAALFLDGLIFMLVLGPVFFGVMLTGGGFGTARSDPSPVLIAVTLLLILLLPIAYQVYFLTQKGATPGKMALGLKVVTASGGPISVGRAVARHFAMALSQMIFYLGYLMAAFDEEKRALHDRICETRVIRR